MAKYIVKDPDKGKYEVSIEDGTPQEVINEVIAFMDRDTRETWARDRKERRHTPFSLDALVYESREYAELETTEILFDEQKSEDERMEEYLSVLTETQRRRIRMRLNGMSFGKIAKLEGKDESSVRESVQASYSRLYKHFPKKFPKIPPEKRT